MKFLITSLVLFVVCSVSFAAETEIKLPIFSKTKTLKLQVSEEDIKELISIFEQQREISTRSITANLNDYVDRLLANIAPFADSSGLDPLALQDFHESFLTAYIDLTNGTLSGVGQIERYGDAEATYNTNTRKYTLAFSIQFKAITFRYHYHVVLLLIGPSGYFSGTLNSFRFSIQLGFDFDIYQASVDKASVLNSGVITLNWEGVPILDTILSILTSFVTIVLHPVIITVINLIVQGVLSAVVELINDFLYNLLNPSVDVLLSLL